MTGALFQNPSPPHRNRPVSWISFDAVDPGNRGDTQEWHLIKGLLRAMAVLHFLVHRVGDRRAPVNAVLKRVKVPSAELAVCGSDGSVTASPRGGVESNRSKTATP